MEKTARQQAEEYTETKIGESRPIVPSQITLAWMDGYIAGQKKMRREMENEAFGDIVRDSIH
jgi:hypothetical protein